MSLPIPLGIDDFRIMRERELAYIDKSYLIRECLALPGSRVLALSRPRRFGKSLNLSMLRYFFEKRDEDLSHLFADLAVWRAGDEYRDHFQRYPVIYFTFQNIGSRLFEHAWGALREKIRDLYNEHRYLLTSGALSDVDARHYDRILERCMPPERYHDALLELSRHLHRYHGEKVVILIDEYDDPIHAESRYGYGGRLSGFLGRFLRAGLNSNPHLFKAVLTGILGDSMFYGLKNLDVYSVLRLPLSTCFGFTEDEVVALLNRAGQSDERNKVRHWYGGYLFGGNVIYNPWSVMEFLADNERAPRLYWVNTSSNELVRNLLLRHTTREPAILESLLGAGIERAIDENVNLDEVDHDETAMWSLLVATGYLKAEKLPLRPRSLERAVYRLTIPNREVREVYTRVLRQRSQAHVISPRISK